MYSVFSNKKSLFKYLIITGKDKLTLDDIIPEKYLKNNEPNFNLYLNKKKNF